MNTTKRWGYLATGVFAMLFSGILYAWSILKIPFQAEFGWSSGTLSLNFTLTMCFFCLGAFFGSFSINGFIFGFSGTSVYSRLEAGFPSSIGTFSGL